MTTRYQSSLQGYKSYENGVHVLGDEMDISRWVEGGLLEPVFSRQNGVVITSGTSTRLLEKHYDVRHVHNLERSGTALLFGGSATEADSGGMKARQLSSTATIRVNCGDIYTDHTAPQQIVLAELKAPTSIDGFGGQRELARYLLKVSPTTRKSIDDAVDKAVDILRANKNLGCTIQSYDGFGGHSEILDAKIERLKQAVRINWHIKVFLAPIATQLQNCINARSDLERLIERETPEDVLQIIVPQKNRGTSDTDLILAGAFETLQGSDQLFGDEDKENLFRRLRNQGPWVVAKPCLVRVKLESLGEYRKRWYMVRRQEQRHHVNPNSRAGGMAITAVLSAVHGIISQNHSAFYIVVVLGAFNDEERHDLMDMIPNILPDAAPGQITPVINRMKPRIDERNNAEYGVVVFEGAAEIPKEVTRYLGYTSFQGHR